MRFAAIKGLLSDRNYAIYTTGNAISLTGTWIQAIAFGWLVWEMTRSPFWLGVIGTAGLVPTLFGGLLGGVWADRLDRLRVTATCQILCFMLTFGLFVAYELDALDIFILLAVRVALSAVVAISQPARMALIPNLVGRDKVGPAVSFGSMVFNSARFVGPAIGGALIAHGGIGLAFLVNSLTFVAMSIALLCLRLDRGALDAAPGRPRASIWSDLGGSLSYVRHHGAALTLFVLVAIVVVTVRPISDFLPAIVTRIFGRGVEGVAILTSSLAAGSFLGGLWVAGRDTRGLTTTAITASIAYAACIVGFVLVSNVWAGAAIFATAGFFTASFATAAQTLIQTSVDDAVRGRVMSLWFILSRGGPDLGAFVMGVAATAAGLRAPFVAGAVLAALASLWAWRRRGLLARSLETVAA